MSPEVTILMPCLNEAETIGTCVSKAMGWIARSGVEAEVLIADNGSTDGSQELARRAGARTIAVDERGYGSALRAGIEAARGKFVIMGDADDSYDFGALDPFVAELRAGADLVIGNRFRGGIRPGAMPFLHRYLGNPVLSWLGRLFFKVDVGDFHCGLRGIRRESAMSLKLRTKGMEFASEMVVKGGLAGIDIREVPTTLSKDGRTRAPHLRTWRDGWRHLRFLLLYAPAWLFLAPGLALLSVGLVGTAVLTATTVEIGSIRLDIGALLFAMSMVVVGAQAVAFALFSKVYGVSRGFLPPSPRLERVTSRLSLERGLVTGFLVFLAGVAGTLVSFLRWRASGWGDLDTDEHLRTVIPAVLGLVVGAGVVLGSFFLSILSLDQDSDL